LKENPTSTNARFSSKWICLFVHVKANVCIWWKSRKFRLKKKLLILWLTSNLIRNVSLSLQCNPDLSSDFLSPLSLFMKILSLSLSYTHTLTYTLKLYLSHSISHTLSLTLYLSPSISFAFTDTLSHTQTWSFSPSLPPSLSLSHSLSVCVSVSLSVCACVCLCVCDKISWSKVCSHAKAFELLHW